jgi:hypothetical protein
MAYFGEQHVSYLILEHFGGTGIAARGAHHRHLGGEQHRHQRGRHGNRRAAGGRGQVDLSPVASFLLSVVNAQAQLSATQERRAAPIR